MTAHLDLKMFQNVKIILNLKLLSFVDHLIRYFFPELLKVVLALQDS